MIVGTGIDIVDVSRIRTLVDRYGERFLDRWFDATEIDYCRLKARPAEHFAARLAAKEAAVKALRISGNVPLCWKDIVVERSGDGAPALLVRGRAREIMERLNVTWFHLSLSHCGAYAVAMVTAERSDRID